MAETGGDPPDREGALDRLVLWANAAALLLAVLARSKKFEIAFSGDVTIDPINFGHAITYGPWVILFASAYVHLAVIRLAASVREEAPAGRQPSERVALFLVSVWRFAVMPVAVLILYVSYFELQIGKPQTDCKTHLSETVWTLAEGPGCLAGKEIGIWIYPWWQIPGHAFVLALVT